MTLVWVPRVIHPAIKEIVASAGCDGIWEWLQQWPVKYYSAISDDSGKRFTATHIVLAEFTEAFTINTVVNVAKDTLLRELWFHCPNGWENPNPDLDSDYFRAKVCFNWHGKVRWGLWAPEDAYPPLKVPQVYHVWNALKAINPPNDWLPQSIDDELLTKAFEHWSDPK